MTNEQLRAELLPCPICGERASFVRQGTRRKSCIVACDSCGASLETSEEGEHCGKAWNRRAALQSQEQPISYAGVTVWVGDKRCSYGFTKDELELSTLDILQAAFDHARRSIEDK